MAALVSLSLTGVAAMHLIAVYLAMMAPLVCLWLQWRARRDPLAARLDRFLLRLAIAALLAAVVLGGTAIGLISRSFPDAYLAAARVLPPNRYWPFGVIELFFSFCCFALAARLRTTPEAVSPRFAARWLATLLGSLNLIYHFPPLFVMLGVLSTRHELWGERLKFTTLLGDAEVLARVAHHLLAALIVTGMAIAWYGVRRGGEALTAVGWGCRIAAAALVCQLFTGLWLVVSLPPGSRDMLLGADALAALFFGGSLLITFLVLPRVAAAAFGESERRAMLITIALVFTIVLLMTAARHRTRALFHGALHSAGEKFVLLLAANEDLSPITAARAIVKNDPAENHDERNRQNRHPAEGHAVTQALGFRGQLRCGAVWRELLGANLVDAGETPGCVFLEDAFRDGGIGVGLDVLHGIPVDDVPHFRQHLRNRQIADRAHQCQCQRTPFGKALRRHAQHGRPEIRNA